MHGGVVNMVGRTSSEGDAPAYRVEDSQGQCHPISMSSCHPVTIILCHPDPPWLVCTPAVFNTLLVASLKNMAALLDHHLPPHGKRPSKQPNLRVVVRQYLKDLVVVSGRTVWWVRLQAWTSSACPTAAQGLGRAVDAGCPTETRADPAQALCSAP